MLAKNSIKTFSVFCVSGVFMSRDVLFVHFIGDGENLANVFPCSEAC